MWRYKGHEPTRGGFELLMCFFLSHDKPKIFTFSLALRFIRYGFMPSDEPFDRDGFFSKEQVALTGWKRMTKQKRGRKRCLYLQSGRFILNAASLWKWQKKLHRRRQEYLSDGSVWKFSLATFDFVRKNDGFNNDELTWSKAVLHRLGAGHMQSGPKAYDYTQQQ